MIFRCRFRKGELINRGSYSRGGGGIIQGNTVIKPCFPNKDASIDSQETFVCVQNFVLKLPYAPSCPSVRTVSHTLVIASLSRVTKVSTLGLMCKNARNLFIPRKTQQTDLMFLP